jgi:chaperonin GroES
MATQQTDETLDTDHDEATEVETSRVTMLDAIKLANLVPKLAASDVSKIGSDALQEYQTDLTSCEDFHERYDRAMDTAMQVKKDKTFPWKNASNVIFPLLTTAAIQFQARAYPAIIDGGKVVKGAVLGPDPEGQKRERADRVASYMTWQFLNDVPGWEEDTDKLLLQLPIVGCVFRKTWRDTLRNQNNSETVTAKDFVVNYKTTSLDKAPRFTHVQRYYPYEIEAFIRTGEWSAVKYEGDDGGDPHSLVEIYEQTRLIDMDGDGLPEPYVVTLTTDGAVARIAACYDADGIFLTTDMLDKQVTLSDLMGMGPEVLGSDVRVVRIERKNYWTKYGFIPAPDGSFYDIGFGTLTDNLGAAVNTIINQLIDAGTLANMQGGFIAGGTKIRGGNMRFTPGEWKRVDGVTSGPLRDNILPLQLPGPNATLFQLLGMLIEAVQNITSVSDIMSGTQDSQTAPTTALALIEQGQKVFTAIYQRIHRALGVEIKIMAGLNRDYLDEEQYFALDDNPQVVGKADFEDKDLDVKPVSDPRAINDQVKMAKAQILMGHNGDPLVNQEEIRRREFEAAGITDIPALLKVPTPPPPPEAIKAMADTENETAKAKAEVRNKDALTAKTLIEAATAAYALGTSVGDPNIQAETTALLAEAMALADAVNTAMSGGIDGGQPVDQPGGVPGMEGAPADGGLPPVPAGPLPDVGDVMGGGPAFGPEGAIPGGDAGGPGLAGVQ